MAAFLAGPNRRVVSKKLLWITEALDRHNLQHIASSNIYSE